jgi:protein TonB
MRLSTLALPAVAMSIAQPATARYWPATAGWDVVEGEDFCAIHLEYEGKGETELSLGLEADGQVFLMLSNAAWSIKKGDKSDMDFYLNGKAYGGGTAYGIGEIGDKPGFGTNFGQEFLRDFAAAPSIAIYKGETLVDRLKLTGSGAALAVAKRCLAAVMRDKAAAEAEKRKFEDIADDPFAKPPGEPAKPGDVPARPIPLGVISSWFPVDSYPAAAKRAGAQGQVRWELDVDEDGRVTGCRIVASTGNADLDAATCRLAQRNGRFERATPGKYGGATNWSLRDE